MPALKLLAFPTSPYGARIVMQAYEKGIDMLREVPSADFCAHGLLHISPFGKTPVLFVNGLPIRESAAIQEYLEDVNPEPALRPASLVEMARMRAIIRAIDLYLFPVLFQLRTISLDNQDDAMKVSAKFEDIILKLEALCDESGYLVGNGLSLADCALVPVYFYEGFFLKRHGLPSILEGRSRLQGWVETLAKHQSFRNTLEDLQTAISKR